MLVETDHGAWMVPPHQGVWIPGAVAHAITMLDRVATRSVYLDGPAADGMARHCRVIGVSPLLRALLIAAVDLPTAYDPESAAGRVMALVVDEIRAAPELPLSLKLPGDGRLAARCRRFIAQPTAQDTRSLAPRARHEPPDLHAFLQARDRPDLLGLAAARLPVVGLAAPGARRAGDDDRVRSRLFEPGRVHGDVQAVRRAVARRLAQGRRT
jgi:hypothetical protein